jgi:nicotinate-nucleotide pyrophosphorylase
LIERVDSNSIARQVAAALAEDLGAGDVTAALVPASQQVRA